jgi:hypothetical protein
LEQEFARASWQLGFNGMGGRIAVAISSAPDTGNGNGTLVQTNWVTPFVAVGDFNGMGEADLAVAIRVVSIHRQR